MFHIRQIFLFSLLLTHLVACMETVAVADDQVSFNRSADMKALASELMIDASVHTGTDWNGAPNSGVWGTDFLFRMKDYPLTWAISLVHASLLLQSREVNYNPNAVLSVAIKESRLGCREASFPNDDGCFQIEDGTAYLELTKLFSNRFKAPFTETISGDHFESAALSMVYYTLFSMSMFHLHDENPYQFFASHPDPAAQQKVISAAYNRGLWWEALKKVFRECKSQDVTKCFVENGTPHHIAIDHANAIADYTKGLNKVPSFEATITMNDLMNYWDRIKALYPDADEPAVQALFKNSFSESASLSFQHDLDGILTKLIAILSPVPTHTEVTKAVCGVGYLWQSPPCP